MKKYTRKKGVTSVEATKNTGTIASKRKGLDKLVADMDAVEIRHEKGRPLHIRWWSGPHNGRLRWNDGNYLVLKPDDEINAGYKPLEFAAADFEDRYELEAGPPV